MIWLRSLAFTVAFYVWSAGIAIVMTPILLGPRRWTVGMINCWSRVVIWLTRVVAGVKTEFRGLEHLPKGAVLVAGKHQCMYDTFAPWVVFPDAAYVLKKELLMIPWFGWYAGKGGNIVINREGAASALKKLVRDAKERFARGQQVLIFPEGTRGKPGEKPDYKPGIAALYRELERPCCLMATNSGAHWPAHGFIRKPGTIVYEFLPPIPPGLKRAEFMRELESRLEGASDALLASGI
ncbi:MAG: 1-acyl-sn-glycerol-3-phosphate acyltransferase [Caulobacter sp.]|nr:1-acyl-sn-glycerol-3-phosphate acyltransferase [Caulobacter sp.]